MPPIQVNSNDSITPGQVLLPTLLLALVMSLFLGFQMFQLGRDYKNLNQLIGQQEKPLEEAHKLQMRLTALALGTKKLADGGDKFAATIIERMQQSGITVGDTGAAPASSTPAPTTHP